MKLPTSIAWSVDKASREYGIDRWGDGYFSVSKSGTVLVWPGGPGSEPIDLKALVDRLVDRGLKLPILIRFNGILRDRLSYVEDCFTKAIADHDYGNRYRLVFPIKVNQQREVVEQVVGNAKASGCGIEVGSKPELIAAIAMSGRDVPVICNGFKDEHYLRLAMMAQRLGRTVIPVIEKASELDLMLPVASEIGVRPTFGARVKLATRGSGRWQASGGYRSKFGLTVAEVLSTLDRLIELDMADCFQLLHFHVGSQVGSIRHLKAAILEASRIYVDLKKRGAAMGYLDVGGGLGVDYDGSRSDTPSSMNYCVQEYANDVVFHVKTVCDEAAVEHPQLISESGRAVAAHHSVLVMDTLGVTTQGGLRIPDSPMVDPEANADQSDRREDDLVGGYEQPVQDLWKSNRGLNAENMMETFHDAQVSLDLCMNLFSGGYLSLEQRVVAENLYFTICHRVREMTASQPDHHELAHLDRMLSDIYFVNFSLFQSLPDAWAIDHRFPIMPIHRLNERPTRPAVLGDVTCDSDGKVDSFIGCEGLSQTINLHPLRAGEPYQLAVFLVGAYQEILGDLHNLFGDTHAVHVDNDGGAVNIRSIVKGDTISEVLGYVQYDNRELIERLQQSIEEAVSESRINHQQAGHTVSVFEEALSQYTYLNPARSEASHRSHGR